MIVILAILLPVVTGIIPIVLPVFLPLAGGVLPALLPLPPVILPVFAIGRVAGLSSRLKVFSRILAAHLTRSIARLLPGLELLGRGLAVGLIGGASALPVATRSSTAPRIVSAAATARKASGRSAPAERAAARDSTARKAPSSTPAPA